MNILSDGWEKLTRHHAQTIFSNGGIPFIDDHDIQEISHKPVFENLERLIEIYAKLKASDMPKECLDVIVKSFCEATVALGCTHVIHSVSPDKP